jgi:hypothetical protein
MNGKIIELEPSEHQQVEKLLPWLLVDGLSAAELERVHRHLEGCPQCQSDLAWQRQLLQLGEPSRLAEPDVERAFAAIDKKLGPTSRPTARRFAWPSLQGGWLPWALGAQSLVIALLAVALWQSSGDPTPYRTLGTPTTAGGQIIVTFRETTTEAELRRILRGSNARIVDGPTLSGGYVLSTADTPATVTALRREPSVTLAEPLVAGAQR